MSHPLYAFPPSCEQTLRALARYPERTAFSWPGGSMTYRGATDMIGRMQAVFMKLGFQPGTRVAFLTANRADTWCAGSAAQLSRLAITWLHPLGSLDDQLFQLEDSEAQMMVVDGVTFRDRGGELATRASGLKTIFTLGPADYGVDLLQTIEDAGSATARTISLSLPSSERHTMVPANGSVRSRRGSGAAGGARCRHSPARASPTRDADDTGTIATDKPGKFADRLRTLLATTSPTRCGSRATSLAAACAICCALVMYCSKPFLNKYDATLVKMMFSFSVAIAL